MDGTSQNNETFASELDQFLTKLISHGGFELHPTVKIQSNTLYVNFTGEDVPLLLGHNAEFLNIVEYLASRVFSHYLQGETRMKFDAGSYRSRREHELHLMAEAAAERVKRYRKPFTLNPMTSAERRVVHLALSHDSGVRTESIGDGDDRKIVIHPV